MSLPEANVRPHNPSAGVTGEGVFRMAETESAKPARNWFHIPIQLVVAGFCFYWYWRTPAPNKASLGLAAVAAIMALVEMRPLHKAIYFSLIVCLLFVENRAIDKDRRDFAEAEARRRQEENAEFSGIGNTITTNVQKLLDHSDEQFSETMGNMGGILEKQDKTLTQTMGGTSYPLFIATFPTDSASREWSVFVHTPGKPWPHGHIPTLGETAPLPDVTVDLTEWPLKIEEMTKPEVESIMHPTHYNLGTLIVPGTFTAPFKLREGKRYTLQITTRRGSFREDIYIDRDTNTPGGWRESWCIYGRRTIRKNGTVTSEEKLLDGKCS